MLKNVDYLKICGTDTNVADATDYLNDNKPEIIY